MTKRHFEAIAKALRTQHNFNYGEVDAQSFIHHIAWMLAGTLQPFNGLFKPEKFVNACIGRKNEEG